MIPREFLGAFKAGHRAASRPFIDEEFSYQLLRKWKMEGCEESRQALEYITKFNNEFHKNVVKKNDQSALHKSETHRKDCYDRDSARRRDIFTSFVMVEVTEFTT